MPLWWLLLFAGARTALFLLLLDRDAFAALVAVAVGAAWAAEVDVAAAGLLPAGRVSRAATAPTVTAFALAVWALLLLPSAAGAGTGAGEGWPRVLWPRLSRRRGGVARVAAAVVVAAAPVEPEPEPDAEVGPDWWWPAGAGAGDRAMGSASGYAEKPFVGAAVDAAVDTAAALAVEPVELAVAGALPLLCLGPRP